MYIIPYGKSLFQDFNVLQCCRYSRSLTEMLRIGLPVTKLYTILNFYISLNAALITFLLRCVGFIYFL